MLALYIITGVLLLLFLLMLFNIYIYADYNNELFLSLKVAFIKIKLLPQKPEKKVQPKKKARKKGKAKILRFKKICKTEGRFGDT